MARVLVVGRGAPERGGIPAFLSLVAASDLASRHDLQTLNLTPRGTERAGGRACAANVRRTLGDVVRVWRAAAGADVVHVHTALAPAVTILRAGALALAGRARGARVAVHAHGGLLATWLRGRARRATLRLALAPATLVLAVSHAGYDALAHILGPDRVRVLPNGVDTQRFVPGSGGHDPPRVLYVGTLTPRKGVIDLIHATERLAAAGVICEVVLIGGMPDEGSAAEEAVRRAADGRVRLLGSRAHEEMPEAYRDGDVLCLPSWWEAAPLSVLEGMASGLPVVATAVGDLPRMVTDGVTGRLVAPRDPDGLAAALAPLLTDPAARRRYGLAARRHVEREFSAHATVDAIDAVYCMLSTAAGGTAQRLTPPGSPPQAAER